MRQRGVASSAARERKAEKTAANGRSADQCLVVTVPPRLLPCTIPQDQCRLTVQPGGPIFRRIPIGGYVITRLWTLVLVSVSLQAQWPEREAALGGRLADDIRRQTPVFADRAVHDY